MRQYLFTIVVLFAVLLACGNKKPSTITAPEPSQPSPPTDSNQFFSFYEDWYFTSNPNIIALHFYETNMSDKDRSLPIVGAFLFDKQFDLYAIIYGKYYEDMDWNARTATGRVKESHGIFETVYAYVFVDLNVNDIPPGSYALWFVSDNKDIVRGQVDKYLSLLKETEPSQIQGLPK